MYDYYVYSAIYIISNVCFFYSHKKRSFKWRNLLINLAKNLNSLILRCAGMVYNEIKCLSSATQLEEEKNNMIGMVITFPAS